MRIILALWVIAIVFAGVSSAAKLAYPRSKKGDVVDDHHGTLVPDPFRWLEDDVRTSTEVASWVAAQNKVTFGYLEKLPSRPKIRQRLESLWNYERYSSPARIGDRYFFFLNDGLQNQSVLYASDALNGEAKVVLDPNSWSSDGTISLAGLSFSETGKYLAYAMSNGGSDWSEWFVLDTETGTRLDDHIEWTKFSGAAWTLDEKGFFYSRFDAPAEGREFQALNKSMKLYYHRLGTQQSDDVLVYHRPDEPDWGFFALVSEDGRYLVISVWPGKGDNNGVMIKDLAEPYGMPTELIEGFEHSYSFVGSTDQLLYFKTDDDAPNSRLIAIDSRRPGREHWLELVVEAPESLQDVGVVANMFVASYLKDAVSYVRIFGLDGTPVRDVKFPGFGTAEGFSGKRVQTETFYTYGSFNQPPSIYRYDMTTGKSELWKQAKVDFNPDDYVVEQLFYPSKDGTRVSMFVAHKNGLKKDGKRPTLLYGYGGFNVSLSPGFSVTRLAWMEMGGVFAMPNLRGGGEYGEAWHDAGTKERKQNVFDDFIAAAEFLQANGYTQPSRTAIQGGSNGGLLVGAVMVQRPELFGAALPAVGVMDMLRFHRFTAGRYWTEDYGSADVAEEFAALYAYSPYHNLKKGVAYPATLVTTADTDDRVVPGHSFKFAARLQEAHAGEAPVLIRIETSAGHGAGKPTQKLIDEAADLWAFLAVQFGIEGAQ